MSPKSISLKIKLKDARWNDKLSRIQESFNNFYIISFFLFYQLLTYNLVPTYYLLLGLYYIDYIIYIIGTYHPITMCDVYSYFNILYKH